jgi:hypothetical protein
LKKKTLKYAIFLFLTIAVVNFLFAAFLHLLARTNHFTFLGENLMLALASISSSLILSLIIICTTPFFKDFLTVYKQRMKLENLSHPLLLKLSTGAAGTYHHSLTVANLANKAAKAIEVDSLLCRVGGYYHDIGKLKNPSIFIENQKVKQVEISDKKLVKIIIGHVKEGEKLAKEYNLPSEITDLILQHHGTMKYKTAAGGIALSYPGPKPLTKEAAIVMIADSIEAGSRALNKPNNFEIEHLVDKIIDTRIDQKQLTLSGLTNFDLERLKISFIESLTDMYHKRISPN